MSRSLLALALALALLLIALDTIRGSDASQQQSSNNSATVTAGSITAVNGTSTAFSLTDVQPGDTTSRCVVVSNAGTLPFDAVGISALSTGALTSSLGVVVDIGSGATGGASGSCTGFTPSSTGVIDTTLDLFPNEGSPYLDTTNLAVGDARSYRFEILLDPLTPQSAQGAQAAFTFRLEGSS